MSIKVKIIILAILSLVVATTIGLILFQNTLTAKKEIEKQEIVAKIRNTLFERAVLRDEYLLYREERSITQSQVLSGSIEKLFLQLSTITTLADEQVSLKNLRDNTNSINQIFSKIVGQVNSRELEQRLISQLLIKSQENFGITAQLAEASRNKVTESQQRATFFVLVSVVGIILIIIFVLYFIWLSIAKPLFSLKENALRIASLDFSATTTTGKNDEMGQLARAFNTMVVKLKGFYTTLEQKVKERTTELENKTEELEKANKFMVGRELRMIELKKEIEELKKQLGK